MLGNLAHEGHQFHESMTHIQQSIMMKVPNLNSSSFDMTEVKPLSLSKSHEKEEKVDKYIELEPAELLELMNAVPIGEASEGWDETMGAIVLPLSLDEYWDAFWANDAPYYIQAHKKDEEEHILSYTDWGPPTEHSN